MQGISLIDIYRVDYARHPTPQQLGIPDIHRHQLMPVLTKYIKGRVRYRNDEVVPNGATRWLYSLEMGITINNNHLVLKSVVDIEDGPTPASYADVDLIGENGTKLLVSREWEFGNYNRLLTAAGDIPVYLSWPDDPGVVVHLEVNPVVLVAMLLAVNSASLQYSAGFAFAGSDDPSELPLGREKVNKLVEAFQLMHSSLEDEIHEFYVPAGDGSDVPMSSMATKFLEHI